MNDESISANVSRMQKHMLGAPGNRGGAAIIIDYYENLINKRDIRNNKL